MLPTTPNLHLDDSAGRHRPIFARRYGPPAPATSRTSAVSHDFAALSLFVAGGAQVEQRTLWTVEPGDVLLVPAGEPHRLIKARGFEAWGAGFCVPCLAADRFAALLEPFERVRAGASPVVRIAPERRPFLASLFEELSGASAGAEAPVPQSLLALILHEVARANAEAEGNARPAEAGAEPSVAARSLRYIEQHCLEPLTLAQVAKAMGRTPSHITTALTRATGRSAVAWIIAGRMAEARRRLLHSEERVEEVAAKVGYADVTHFIRLFRRTHGVTPAAWRAAHRRPASG